MKRLMKTVSFILVFAFVIPLVLPGKIQAATEDARPHHNQNDQVAITGCNRNTSGETAIPTRIENAAITGDLDGDLFVGSNDVAYLLWHTLFPEDYPVNQDADFTGDSNVNSDDVAYLLWHTLFPDDYPLEITVIAGGEWTSTAVTWKITSDGVLTFSGKRHIYGSLNYIWKDYSHIIKRVVIEDGITTIPSNAFSSMSNIESVYLGNTVTSIDQYAFSGCTALESINLPPSLQTINWYAFSRCTALKSLQIPDVPLTIGECAFQNCGFEELIIPVNIKKINNRAFSDCESLENLVILGGTLGARVFENCTSLKHLEIHESANILGGYSFYNIKGIQTLELYQTCHYEFYNMKHLTHVTLGGSKGTTGRFDNCPSLVSVTILNGIHTISHSAFQKCTALTSVQIPDSVTSIETNAFRDSGVTSLVIPESVKSIDMFAFMSSALQKVTFLGDAPTYIQHDAFKDATVTIYYPADNPTWTQELRDKLSGNITWIGI